MDGFEAGYKFFGENTGAVVGAFNTDAYVQSVNDEIDKLVNDLNAFEGFKTSTAQLKGDVFEFWQSDTFNIDAVIKGSGSRTFVDRSNDFGSVDVTSNFGKDFGLKAYSSGEASASAQSVSIFQRFKEYQAHGGKDGLDKFLSDRGYDSDTVLSDSIYTGQVRVIPRDQLEEATKWLEKMIRTEMARRPEQVERYKETLSMLNDKLSDDKGVESIPLSKAEAEELARLAKEGNIDAEALGLTPGELIKYEYIIKQSLKAGLTAATITMVLKVAPEIYKAISYLIKEGEIDEEQFKKIGFAAVSGASEGFIRGTVAGAITVCCKSGLLGKTLVDVEPTIVGTVTAIAFNVIKNSFMVAKNEKTRRDLANDLIRDMYISACSLIGGGISQMVIEVPVLGYMVGSFIGSVVGSFTYNVEQKAIISFCVDSGFTMFGLVEQDYKLPEDIIKLIGIETFDYEKIEPETFEPDTFSFETFKFDTFEPDNIGINYLSRGVIGVHRIGYV